MTASGEFEVKLTAQAAGGGGGGDNLLGRLLIDKQFSGELVGNSAGEMLSAGTTTKGSAGYVAIEKVTGAIQGRAGTFILQHSGTMKRGEGQLSVTVVPDSGTEELTGLTGRMTIRITGGKHFYDFEYSLEDQP